MKSYSVNFLGWLFSRIKKVEVSSEAFLIITRKEKCSYGIDSIALVPEVTESIFGAKLSIHTDLEVINLSFIKKAQGLLLQSHLEKLIIERAQERIEKSFQDLQKKACSRYLRDSHIERLAADINACLKLHLPIIHKLEFELQGTLKDLESIHPLEEHADRVRQNFIDLKLVQRKSFFDQIESNPLTEQQRLAVIRENDRNLILAAAGTGKTSVMIAKALDIVETDSARPEEVLVLAYNKAATVELTERIDKRANLAGIETSHLPEIFTFHALGRKVLNESGITTLLSKFAEDPLALRVWASAWFEKKIEDSPGFLKEIIDLMSAPVNVFDFQTKEDYDHYISDNEYRTLNGELVRGYQELLIANWLFLNNVSYDYERRYVTKRRISVGLDYKPDFYISGTSIYLEHFGIDRKGNTAPWIDRDEYNEITAKKRQLHRENGTTLIETYHYNWVEKSLEDRLEALLEQFGIRPDPKSEQEVFEHLNETKVFDKIVDLYLKCLDAIRVERLSDEDILERLNTFELPNAERYQVLLVELHDAYRKELLTQNTIDFHDMIIRATEQIDAGKFTPSWKYILVDEFQDISMARMQMLQALVKAGPEPILTVVGDDWQSIYRFSGGKLELTTRFDELVGSHSTTKLEKTFRYNSSIAHTAGTFVMENPEQYRKDVVTHEVVNEPQVFLYDSKILNKELIDERARQILFKKLKENPGSHVELFEKTRQTILKIREKDSDGSIAILARYNYLLKDLKAHLKNFAPEKNIKFWTFHGSKGLEADNCILIGFFQGKAGFPNQNKDEEVVEALLPLLDTYEHSEERRLLYVAMTRARRRCYLLGNPTAPSDFILELLSPKYQIHIGSKTFKKQYRDMFKCPKCAHGHYRLHTSKHGQYYQCTTGPSCPSKPRVCEKCGAPSVDYRNESICNNPNCNHEQKLCPLCGRPMKLREGQYGKFWGCTGYGVKDDQCDYTEKYQQSSNHN